MTTLELVAKIRELFRSHFFEEDAVFELEKLLKDIEAEEIKNQEFDELSNDFGE